MKKTGLFLVIMMAGLVLVSSQALSYGQRKGPDRIGDDLDDIMYELSHERSLDRGELRILREDLADIRWQLAELQDNWQPKCGGCGSCDYCSWGGGESYGNDDWNKCDYGHRSGYDGQAKFNGWGAHARIDYDLGDYGELHVHIDNDYRNSPYHVDWVIDNAWGPNARFEIERHDRGDIYVIVNDDHGKRRFRMKNGGLDDHVYINGKPMPSNAWENQRKPPARKPVRPGRR
jgi:hypothetical protein